jgi:hypothetical protein
LMQPRLQHHLPRCHSPSHELHALVATSISTSHTSICCKTDTLVCLKSQLQCFNGGRFVYPKTCACRCAIRFYSYQILYSLYINDVATQEFGVDVVCG